VGGIDPKRIALFGYSVFIAPMVAAKDLSIAAIITLAGPGVPMSEVARNQVEQGIILDPKIPALDEVLRSHQSGELRECFGTGTAATVSHIRRIRHKDETMELPPIEQRKVGPLVREKLLRIMTGRQPDTHGWVERI
jgi:branched-chain amino acid aminotransferase